MKLFIAEKHKKGYNSKKDYHWANNGEILMFGQFQTANNRQGKGTEFSMCGIKTRKFTTHIIVKETDKTKEEIFNMILDSIEKSMKCKVNYDGTYKIDLGGFVMDGNINDIFSELIEKAEQFNDGDKVMCRGRKILKVV